VSQYVHCSLPLLEMFAQSSFVGLLQHTDHDFAPFRGGGGGVIGAAMLGLLDRDPFAGLELPESPPLPLANGRTLLAAECGLSFGREGAALRWQDKISEHLSPGQQMSR
jgi:hypothetical protein